LNSVIDFFEIFIEDILKYDSDFSRIIDLFFKMRWIDHESFLDNLFEIERKGFIEVGEFKKGFIQNKIIFIN
jgi:hypothetical protein